MAAKEMDIWFNIVNQEELSSNHETVLNLSNFEVDKTHRMRKRKPEESDLMDSVERRDQNEINFGFQNMSSRRDNNQPVWLNRDSLFAFGVYENGQEMIPEFMSIYDRNISNQTCPVVGNQSMNLLQPTAQNHQEQMHFGPTHEGNIVEGSFSEDLMNISSSNNNNNQFFSRFELMFDSPPLEMASFDGRQKQQNMYGSSY